jgi:hypothetical protein
MFSLHTTQDALYQMAIGCHPCMYISTALCRLMALAAVQLLYIWGRMQAAVVDAHITT